MDRWGGSFDALAWRIQEETFKYHRQVSHIDTYQGQKWLKVTCPRSLKNAEGTASFILTVARKQKKSLGGIEEVHRLKY